MAVPSQGSSCDTDDTGRGGLQWSVAAQSPNIAPATGIRSPLLVATDEDPAAQWRSLLFAPRHDEDAIARGGGSAADADAGDDTGAGRDTDVLEEKDVVVVASSRVHAVSEGVAELRGTWDGQEVRLRVAVWGPDTLKQ